MKTPKTLRSALVAIVAVGAAIAVTGPAIAAEGAPQAHVRTRGFNLSDPADRALVLQKIRSSARQVCRGAENDMLSQRLSARRCYQDAVQSASGQLADIEARGTNFAQAGNSAGSALPK